MASPSAEDPSVSAEPSTILFRPTKKRKAYRQRAAEQDDDDAGPSNTAAIASPTPIASLPNATSPDEEDEGDAVEGTRVSMAEILRLRKQKKRIGGVEFRSHASNPSINEDSNALVITDGPPHENVNASEAPVRQFAKQTGMVGDVDKHMMAYIDSELAKRRQGAVASTSKSAYENTTFTAAAGSLEDVSHGHGTSSTVDRSSAAQRQPATLGKIQEIDLSLHSDETDVRAGQPRVKKVRLGPDGKPWRGRKRRGSDDVKRDQIVEQVLRENRIELYEPTPAALPAANNTDGENDDRIAEEFKREFLDAISERQRKKPIPPPVRGPGGRVEEEPKGPKLGGSRSQRAKMRESELKALKK